MRRTPNIIYIISHDLGDHISPYGVNVETPALQSLADKGVVFANHFSNATVCSPARGSL